MKNILVLFILLFNTWAFGQIAVIKDKDGFTNVRKQPNINADIIYKLKDTEVFFYEKKASNPDWIMVYISKNKFQLESDEDHTMIGYIHKSRLLPLSELEEYQGSEFSFEYKFQDFKAENKILDYKEKWLLKINGRRFYGTDGAVPKVEVKAVEVFFKGRLIPILDVLYEDIFECNDKFVIHENKGNYIVHHFNSDGAGGYLIAWVFNEIGLKQRFILTP